MKVFFGILMFIGATLLGVLMVLLVVIGGKEVVRVHDAAQASPSGGNVQLVSDELAKLKGTVDEIVSTANRIADEAERPLAATWDVGATKTIDFRVGGTPYITVRSTQPPSHAPEHLLLETPFEPIVTKVGEKWEVRFKPTPKP